MAKLVFEDVETNPDVVKRVLAILRTYAHRLYSPADWRVIFRGSGCE